jgi:hypothetical protein
MLDTFISFMLSCLRYAWFFCQTKQKKNNRKVKVKGKDEKYEVKILERLQDETAIDDGDLLPAKQVEMAAKVDVLEDCASDESVMSNRLVNTRNKLCIAFL